MLFFCPGLWEAVRHQQWQGGVWDAAAKQGPHQCSLALGVAASAVGAACSNPLTWEAAGAEGIKQENIETTNHTCQWVVVLRLVKCWGLHCLDSTCLISAPQRLKVQRPTFPLWFPRDSFLLILGWDCQDSFSFSSELIFCTGRCPGDISSI